MLRLDAEALRRERTCRRLFGVGVNLATVAAMSRQAAASGMEAVSGNLGNELGQALSLLFIVLLGVIGFCAVFWLLLNVSAALTRSRRVVRLERDAADEAWF